MCSVRRAFVKSTKARREKKRFLRAVKSKALDANIKMGEDRTEIAVILTGGGSRKVFYQWVK